MNKDDIDDARQKDSIEDIERKISEIKEESS